jgi:hypothetical protein
VQIGGGIKYTKTKEMYRYMRNVSLLDTSRGMDTLQHCIYTYVIGVM